MAVTIGRLVVEMAANTAAFQSDMRKSQQIVASSVGAMRRTVETVGQSFETVRSRVTGLIAALGAFGAASALSGALRTIGDLGEMGQQAGVTAGQLHALQIAGVQANLSTEQLQTGLEKLTRQIGEAADGSDSAVKAFGSLGISVLNAQGHARGTVDVLRELANSVAAASTNAERGRIAFEVLGRAGQKFVPLLAQGAEGIDKAMAQIGGRDMDKLSDEFDKFFDRAAANALKFRAALAGVVSDVRGFASDRTIATLLGAAGGGAAGAIVGGPIGGIAGMAIGGMAGSILGKSTEIEDTQKAIAKVNAELKFNQDILDNYKPGAIESAFNKSMLANTSAAIQRLTGDLGGLNSKLDELKGIGLKPVSIAAPEPSNIRPVSDDEITRLQEARALTAQLATARASYNRPEAVALANNLKAQEKVQRLTQGEIDSLRQQGQQVKVLTKETEDYGERLGGKVVVSVRKFTDAQVESAVAQQRVVDGMKAGEQVRAIMNLVPQIEAARMATVQWNALTNSYEVNTSALDTLRLAQDLNTGSTALGIARSAEMAATSVATSNEIKRAMEQAQANAKLSQVRRDTPKQTEELNAQAEAAKLNRIEWDAVTNTYRVTSREVDILRKSQELLNTTVGLSTEEATALAASYVDANEKMQRITDTQNEQVRRMNDAAGDLSKVVGTAFEDALLKGAKFRELISSLAQDIARLALRMAVTKPLEGFLGNALQGINIFGGGGGSGLGIGGSVSALFGGPRAGGGPVSGGKAYMVGEQGPELFIPGSSGTIAANGGGAVINIAPTINVQGTSPDDAGAKRMASAVTLSMRDMVQDQIRRAMRPGGMIYGT